MFHLLSRFVRSYGSVFVLAAMALAPRAARADDHEDARVLGLLDAAAESARDRRVVESVTALAAGTTLVGAGVASWATPSGADARTARDVVGGVFVGVGSALTLAGGLGLLAPSSIEQLRAVHAPALRAGGAQRAAAAVAIGVALAERASSARTERRVSAGVSFAAGVVAAAGGVALEAQTSDHGLLWLGRSLLVASAGSMLVGIGELVVRSEEERLYDLFRQRSAPRATTGSSLRVLPSLGLGSVGFTGRF